MELTKNTFRKIILVSLGLMILQFIIHFFPFLTDYGPLEEQLNGPKLSILEDDAVYLSIIFIILFMAFISMFLLYFFKSIGRPLYVASILLGAIFGTLGSDTILHANNLILYELGSFVEIFVIVIIYFTPLKKEFEK
jgi:Na+-driven multidrug efflux pump